MKSFIAKAAIIVILLVCIDFSIGYILDYFFTDLPRRESETSMIYRSLFTEETDNLVLGPSSAMHHYNPTIISDSLGGRSYNAGIDGRDIILADLFFCSIRDRSDLNNVLIDISKYMDGRWKYRLSSIKQYYGRHPYVTKYFDEGNWQQKIKLTSNLYRYNGSLHSLISLLLLDKPEDKTNGYRPLYGTSESFKRDTVSAFCLDPEEQIHLQNIVNVCKKDSIQIFLVVSPHCSIDISFSEWLKDFAVNNGVRVIWEGDDVFWYNNEGFFKDSNHLNSEGADIFTQRIVSKIKKIKR